MCRATWRGRNVYQKGEDSELPDPRIFGPCVCLSWSRETTAIQTISGFRATRSLKKRVLLEFWPCNYFNRCENGINGAHVAFTHRESARRANRTDYLAPRSTSVEETEYGLRESQIISGKPTRYVHFHMPNVNQPRAEGRIEGSLRDAEKLWADRLLVRAD